MECLDLARLAQHLVDLVEMQFLEHDHLASILFKQDRLVSSCLKQFVVKSESQPLMFKALAQNVPDVMLGRFQKRANLQRRMTAEQSDQFTGFSRVGEAF